MLASTSAPRAVARLFRARRPPQTRRTRRTSARTPGASASAAGPGPIAVTATVAGATTTTEIPGSGGSEVALGDGDGAVTLTVAQKDGGAGTAGVDAMSKMMQMQFEATMDPEVRKAMEE